MSSVPGVTPTSSTQPASSTDAFSAMSSTDFLEIIFTELTNQDPLQPSDTQALLEQISMIRNIESDLSLGERLEEMVKQNEITSASSLVGKFVTGKTESNVDTAGFVDSVRVTDDGTRLTLSSGDQVTLDRVNDIIDPAIIGMDSGVNERPLAGDDTAAVQRGNAVTIDVLANDGDDSRLDRASVEIVSDPLHAASITFDTETGKIVYTHDGGDATTDSFRYVVTDDEGLRSSPATVVVSIND
jgi:flagellar basal-body rod modification protein FlgD